MNVETSAGRCGLRALVALAAGTAAVGLLLGVDMTRPAAAKAPPRAAAQKGKTRDPIKNQDRPPEKEITSSGGGAFDTKDAEVVRIIDTRLEEAWKENKVRPAPRCDDYEYIRRVYLDIIGRIPTNGEIQAFFRLPTATRRRTTVDQLLDSPAYPDNWANLWCNWLLTRSSVFSRARYRAQLHSWLQEQLALEEKRGYDVFVTNLITAKGKNTENGAVNFIMAHMGDPIPGARQREEGQFDMTPITARITRLFLGIQTQCTQCHDHPNLPTKRKQSDYWGINAFLRQTRRIGRPPGPNARPDQLRNAPELTLVDDRNVNPDALVFYEKRNGVVLQAPAQFFDADHRPRRGSNRRAELARFIINHDNFAPAFVNRMWGHFFGKGFCNPIDDFSPLNEVNHAELLKVVAEKLILYRYDQKRLIRWICNSRAYQLRSTANATNDKPEHEVLFSRMLLKAMTPEQLFSSLMVALRPDLAVPKKGKDRDKTVREFNRLRAAWTRKLVDNFGDDEGNEVVYSGTVVQALLMMNGDEINKTISEKNGIIDRMLARRGTANENITYLFMITLNRPPSKAELTKFRTAMELTRPRLDTKEGRWHDLLWALVNCNEFILNH